MVRYADKLMSKENSLRTINPKLFKNIKPGWAFLESSVQKQTGDIWKDTLRVL